MLHLRPSSIGKAERFASTRVPQLDDTSLIAARKVVPVMAPAETMDFVSMHVDFADAGWGARVMQRDRSITHPYCKDILIPAECADVRLAVLLPQS